MKLGPVSGITEGKGFFLESADVRHRFLK
jgi:hypothetical protein